MNLPASAVVVDIAANAIRLVVPGLEAAIPAGERVEGTLDVGASGRLLGLELGDAYVTVMDPLPGTEALVRSASVTLAVAPGTPPAITVPRLGRDYEISYPSGNQCWQVTTIEGRLIQLCAVTADAPEVPGAAGDGPAPRGR